MNLPKLSREVLDSSQAIIIKKNLYTGKQPVMIAREGSESTLDNFGKLISSTNSI